MFTCSETISYHPRDNSDTPNEATENPEERAGDGDAEQRLIVEFAVPADDFLLASTLEAVPDTVVELEQFVPTTTAPLPYLWTTDDDRATFEEAAADPTVEQIQRIAEFDRGALYQIDRAELDVEDTLVEWLRTADVTVLQAESMDDEWRLKLRMLSRDELRSLQTYCHDHDVQFRLIRLFGMTEPKMGQYNTSEKQHEILVTALEMEYFAVPREATLKEVATELGLSTNAASERLRRAQTNLLTTTVTIGQPTGVGITPQ